MSPLSSPDRFRRLAAIAGIAALLGFGLFISVSNLTIDSVSRHIRRMYGLKAMVSRMTIEEKIGQMLMVGFEGTCLTPAFETFVREHHIGNVILLGRNIVDPYQTAELTNSIQNLARRRRESIGFLISIDQEGGAVVRMTNKATVFPGNMALGAIGSPEYAESAARAMAIEMKACGVNMNLAPVLDVNNNPDNPGIGIRSFSEDPELVSRLGTASIRGYQSEGVVATAKHFPGKGDVTIDSHVDLPTVPHSWERLRAVELVPFIAAISQGVDVVMTAHVSFPAVEPEPLLPATLSRKVLTGLLRDELGFKGVIITDDMLMGAIAKRYGTAEAGVRAVQAGADLVLVCHVLDEQIAAVKALVEAVKSGRIDEREVDASVGRILALKQKRGLLSPTEVDVSRAQSLMGIEPHRALALKIARDSVTLIANSSGLIPVTGHHLSRVLVIAPEIRALTQVETDGSGECPLARAVRGFAPTAESLAVGQRPSAEEIREAVARARDSSLTIVGTYNAHLYREQADLVRSLHGLNAPLIVVAMRNPYDIKEFPQIDTYITGYSFRECSMQAVAEAIFGHITPKGRLPVTLPEARQRI